MMTAAKKSKGGKKAAASAASDSKGPRLVVRGSDQAAVSAATEDDVPRLGIDVGGVLSKKSKYRYPYGEEWKTAMKGAFPFLVLFGLKYGPENIFIISRVNHLPRGDSKHWVNKFVESIGIAEFPRGLGVPEENVRLVTERHGPFGKGPVCKEYGITHYIDDEPDCLWSFWADECGHAAEPAAAFYFDEWRHWGPLGAQIRDARH